MAAVSVVVVHHADPGLLESCLSSLGRQSLAPLEVVLIANGCAEESLVRAARFDTLGLRIVRLAENAGFACGANAGIRAARGDLVALLNDDAQPAPEWLERLAQAAEAHAWASSFASRILTEGVALDSAGDILTRAGELLGRGHGEPDGPAYDADREVFGASAGAALYRRELFDRIGLFDERYFHSSEDADLSLRARLMGERCLYVASARVRHRGGATRRLDRARSIHLQARNVEFAYWSNLPGEVLARTLAWHLARNLWGLAVRLGSDEALPFLRGKWAAAMELPRLLEQRRRRLEAATASFHGLIEPGHPAARFARALARRLARVDIAAPPS